MGTLRQSRNQRATMIPDEHSIGNLVYMNVRRLPNWWSAGAYVESIITALTNFLSLFAEYGAHNGLWGSS